MITLISDRQLPFGIVDFRSTNKTVLWWRQRGLCWRVQPRVSGIVSLSEKQAQNISEVEAEGIVPAGAASSGETGKGHWLSNDIKHGYD